PRADVIDVLVTVDVVEKRPFRSGHERRFAADRPERPRRTVHAAGNHAVGAEEGVVALGKRELGLRSGGSFEGHGRSERCMRGTATEFRTYPHGERSDRPGNQACRSGYRAIEIGPFQGWASNSSQPVTSRTRSDNCSSLSRSAMASIVASMWASGFPNRLLPSRFRILFASSARPSARPSLRIFW